MRLNIVTDDAFGVHDELIKAFHNSIHGVRVYLANRPAEGIVEFDFVSDEPCCITLESIREALPCIRDFDIRIVI